MRDRVRRIWASANAFLTPQTDRVEQVMFPEEYSSLFASMLRLPADGRVVDVCGGIGALARRLSRQMGSDGRAILIDVDRIAGFRARQLACEQRAHQVHVRCASAYEIPLPDAFADAAIMSGFIAPIRDRDARALERALAEIRRVLKPQGRLVYVYPIATLLVGADDVGLTCGMGGEVGATTVERLHLALARQRFSVGSSLITGTHVVPRSRFTELSDFRLDYFPAIEPLETPYPEVQDLDGDYAAASVLSLVIVAVAA